MNMPKHEGFLGGGVASQLPTTEAELAHTAVFSAEEPQATYADRLARCPMARTPSGQVVVLRMEDLMEINRHPAIAGAGGEVAPRGTMGAERPLIPLDLDGAEHKKYRRLLDPLFSPKRVAKLEPIVRQRVNELIDTFIAAGRAEMYSTLCDPLPSGIFVDIMGVPASELQNFIAFKDACVRPPGNTLEEMRAASQEAGRRTYAYFNRVLDERSQLVDPGNDLLGWLMTAEVDDQRLTRLQILDITYLLMIAGLDTVAGSLSCILAWLADHPDQRRWIAEDPGRWPLAVEEIMRFESPVFMGTRTAMQDVVVAGHPFEEGTVFQVSWAAANLDPAAFDDPLTVRLDRESNRHAGFATGRHRCLGSHLARLELRVAMDEFHRRIPHYHVDPDDKVVHSAVGVRIAHHLPLVWRS
jgi:cytochrome P450